MNHPELNPHAPRQNGGGALKWILLGCGGLMLLVVAFVAVSGWAVYRSFDTDPAKVDAAAKEILTFDKPAGLKAVGSVSMMGFKTATYGPEDPKNKEGATMLMVSSFPTGKQNQAQYQQQIDANLKKQGHSQEGAERLPNETFQVRGNDVTAQVSALTDKNTSARSRHYMLLIESSGKTVMIMVLGSEKTIDHAWMQKFLDTVK